MGLIKEVPSEEIDSGVRSRKPREDVKSKGFSTPIPGGSLGVEIMLLNLRYRPEALLLHTCSLWSRAKEMLELPGISGSVVIWKKTWRKKHMHPVKRDLKILDMGGTLL